MVVKELTKKINMILKVIHSNILWAKRDSKALIRRKFQLISLETKMLEILHGILSRFFLKNLMNLNYQLIWLNMVMVSGSDT
jgi:hypothetical protein